MDGNLKKSLSSKSMPSSLMSRLDHLDSTIKYLEDRKCSSARWTNGGALVHGAVNKECMPIDLALKESQSKGSIFDRITSLEDRLVQVCSVIESEADLSPSKTSEVEQDATSPQTKSRKGFSNSFSRFRLPRRSNNNNKKQPVSPISMDKFPITEEKEHNAKVEQSRKSKDEKSSSKQKKFVSSSLLHLRLLGC